MCQISRTSSRLWCKPQFAYTCIMCKHNMQARAIFFWESLATLKDANITQSNILSNSLLSGIPHRDCPGTSTLCSWSC